MDALIVVAQAGLPLEVIANPVMGVTAPYTIAGTVALGHAEVLAAAVMAHAVRPGLPILNGNTPSVADMRTLASTTGGPETGLIRRTVAELSHHLGLPSCVHGHTSSARVDYQAGDEKALNTLLIASARPSILGGLGGWPTSQSVVTLCWCSMTSGSAPCAVSWAASRWMTTTWVWTSSHTVPRAVIPPRPRTYAATPA